MASDKRSFSNFAEFPGRITDNVYRFPTLIWTNSSGKPMIWDATIRLVNPCVSERKYSVNWDTKLDDHAVTPITCVTMTPPTNTIAQMWTVNGRADMNPTTSIPTFIKCGKNLGRSNETNVLTQAMITMRSKYLKKIDSGYTTRDDTAATRDGVKTVTPVHTYYMMAYHKWIDKPVNKSRHIIFPAAVSYKYDGVRVQVHCEGGKIYFSSRRKKLFPAKLILESELMPIFNKYPGIYLDCEAFITGSNLNIINGVMVKENADPDLLSKLCLNVFDIFVPIGCVEYNGGQVSINNTSSFIDRLTFLDHIFSECINCNHLMKVNQDIVSDEKEYDSIHGDAVLKKYEGTVIRNLSAMYEFSDRREVRSYQVRKRKPRYDDKFKVVGYTQGTNGKSVGAIILILETANGKHTFRADPEDTTMGERYEIYKNMTESTFASKWFGKKMTVTYHAISDDGIPLQPKVSFKTFNT